MKRIDSAELDWLAAALQGIRPRWEQAADAHTSEFIEADCRRPGHIGVVLEGRLEIDFSGRVEQYEQGQGLFIPPGEPGQHKAHALSERVLLFVVEQA